MADQYVPLTSMISNIQYYLYCSNNVWFSLTEQPSYITTEQPSYITSAFSVTTCVQCITRVLLSWSHSYIVEQVLHIFAVWPTSTIVSSNPECIVSCTNLCQYHFFSLYCDGTWLFDSHYNLFRARLYRVQSSYYIHCTPPCLLIHSMPSGTYVTCAQ